jgi:agmatine deiminase
MSNWLPPEWCEHECTWITWPRNKSDWPSKFNPIPCVYAEIVRALTISEKVKIILPTMSSINSGVKEFLFKYPISPQMVEFVYIETNRSWIRDYGPIYIAGQCDGDPGLKMLDFRFNGWGKYYNYNYDNLVNKEIYNYDSSIPIISSDVVLEGGSIDVNGSGSLITSESCLLNKDNPRNPSMTKEDYEELFYSHFGVDDIIWLKGKLNGDDTDGHVDELARFVNDDTILVAYERDPLDINYAVLQDNLDILCKTRFNIRKIPLPSSLIYFDGQVLPASYLNFYICNHAVLVPTFNDVNDREALTIFDNIFPGKKVIGINCVDLLLGLGSIHCATMQQPKVY